MKDIDPWIKMTSYKHLAADRLKAWFLDEWAQSGPVVCVLQGVSGVGKTELAREVCSGWANTAALVDAEGLELGFEDLLLDIATVFERQGRREFSDATTFEEGLKSLLKSGCLVVITEFDSALDPITRLPHESVINFLRSISKEDIPGRILIVGSQRIGEGAWSEKFGVKHLGPPEEREALALLEDLLVDRGLENEITLTDKIEVVRWLASNPRAMKAFVICLQEESLETLIDLEPESWALRDEAVSPGLIRRLEEAFAARTLDRLDGNTQLFVEYMSIYRKPFQASAMQKLEHLVADVAAARSSLSNRFLLSHSGSGWYVVHPVVKYLARERVTRTKRRLHAAHNIAADHYMRHFRATGGATGNLATVGGAFVEARYHLIKSGREREFEEVAARYREQLSLHYRHVSRIPTDSSDARTLLIVLLGALAHDNFGFSKLRFILARLLVSRNLQGDREIALRQIALATREMRDVGAWQLRLDLTWHVEGMIAARVVANQAVRRVVVDEVWRIFHLHATKLHGAGQHNDALAFLAQGFEKAHRGNLFGLYSLAAYIYTMTNRSSAAIELLVHAYLRLGVTDKNRYKLFEQAVFIAYGRQSKVEITRILAETASEGIVENVILGGALLRACDGKYAETATMLDDGALSRAIAAQAVFFNVCIGQVGKAAAILANANLADNCATSWLRALVALCEEKQEVYVAEIQRSLGRDLTEVERDDRNLWLRVWLNTPDVQGVYPGFYFPKLPARLIGREDGIVHGRVTDEILDEDFWASVRLPIVEANPDAVQDGPATQYFIDKMEMTVKNGDTWNVNAGAIGAVGDKSKVVKSHIVNNGNSASDFNFEQALEEVQKLRLAMRTQATDPEHDLAIAEVAQAELAARDGDKGKFIDKLKQAGGWAFTVATSIGATLVASILKSEIGL